MSVESSSIQSMRSMAKKGEAFTTRLPVRSIRVVCAVALCAAALLLVCGCAQSTVGVAEPQYITLVSDKVNEVNLGDTLQIVIQENHTTEYRWYYDLSGDDILDVVSDDFSLDSNGKGAEGGGGTRTIAFLVIAPGEATVKMYLMKEMPEPLDDLHEGVASQTVNYQITVE